MIQTFTVPLGGRIANAAGTFLRYESAGTEGADQSLKIRADGQDLGSYLPGDSIELPAASAVWELMPASCSAVVKIGLGRITTVRSTLVGTVAVSTRSVSLDSAQKTVTSGGGSLVAANPSRRYLAVQNKDTAGSIWIRPKVAATQADGWLLGPGGFMEWDGSGVVPPDQFFAIGSIASNANVVVMEG